MEPTLTDEQIHEIAENLDCGFRSFWNTDTGELLFLPDLNENPYIDSELFEEDFEKLDDNFADYTEIEKPNSSESYSIMADFTEQLTNKKLQNELEIALNKKKPFREFKSIIENSGVYRQQWFDFKMTQLKNWVIEKIKEAIIDKSDNE
ncbi:MAG: UPF0158 family protein [Flavobacterium sp.]